MKTINHEYVPGCLATIEQRDELGERFTHLSMNIGHKEQESDKWLVLLGQAYMNPVRTFHNLSYIAYLLDVMDRKLDINQDAELFEACIWFHNAYRPLGTTFYCSPAAVDINVKHFQQYVAGTSLEGKLFDGSKFICAAHECVNGKHRTTDKMQFLEIIFHILGEPRDTYLKYMQAQRSECVSLKSSQYPQARLSYLQSIKHYVLGTRRTPGFDLQRTIALENVNWEMQRLIKTGQ